MLLAICACSLPSCPTSNVKKDHSRVNLLGLNAFVLFKQKKMAILFLFVMLPGASLQISHTFSSPFLHDFVKIPFIKIAW
nr:nucleoside permease [Yersinia aldovae]